MKKIKKYLILNLIYFSIFLLTFYFFIFNILGIISISLLLSNILTPLTFYFASLEKREKTKSDKIILFSLSLMGVYLISIYLTTIYIYYIIMDSGLSILESAITDFEGLINIFLTNYSEILQKSILTELFIIIIAFAIYNYNKKHLFYGKERGSAKWATANHRIKFFLNMDKDINVEFKPFLNYLKEKQFIFTKYLKTPILINQRDDLITALEEKLNQFSESFNKLKNKIQNIKENENKKYKQSKEFKELEIQLKELEEIIADTKKSLSILYDLKDLNSLEDIENALNLINTKLTLYDKPIENIKEPSTLSKFINKFLMFDNFSKNWKMEILSNNIILSNTEFLPKNPNKIYRNTNQLIIGGSGTGKTRTYVKPNVAQLNSNLIITDPKGELYRETGKLLEENGYIVTVLNLVQPKYSARYNIFKYIHNQSDIALLSEIIMKNTQGEDQKQDFWVIAEKALLTTLCNYCYHLKKEKTTLNDVYELLISIKYNEPQFVGQAITSNLDEKMERLSKEDPLNQALSNFKIFNQQPSKMRQSIITSLGTRLSMFGNLEVKELVSEDDFDLEDVECKKAIFVIMSDAVSPYNVIASLFFNQILQLLYYIADFKYRARLPLQWQLILDEFANIGQIPRFSEILSTCRGRGIGISIIIQDLGQLENLYKNNYKTIISNCDTMLFLGTNEITTCEYVSKRIGDTTFKMKNESYSGGKRQIKYSNEKRRLITPEELITLDNDKCVVFVRGLPPFFSDKYKIQRHKLYDYLENETRCNQKNIYNSYENMRKSNLEKFKNLIGDDK